MMILKMLKGILYKTCNILISLVLLSVSAGYCAAPSENMDPNDWKRVVEAAKKEGKLVMSGDPSEEWRKSLVDMFREEYPEITMEYVGMNGRDFAPRVRRERAFGQNLWDLLSSGTATAMEVKGDGFAIPIRPLLLPEIADESKWNGGMKGLFTDKENKYVPTYTLFIQRTTSVNRDFIKGSEIKSSSQLLDPRFKGKIVIQNPTSGATAGALSALGFMYGEKFLRDVLSKQNLIITDDKRQQAEWVVRGKYPLAIGFNETQLMPFVKQGLGKNVIALEDKITPLSTSLGSIVLFKDAPHPNAAKVYINWLLSRNTQIKLCKNVRLNSRRSDVPPVIKELAVDPANLGNYFDLSTEEVMEVKMRLQPVIQEALKR